MFPIPMQYDWSIAIVLSPLRRCCSRSVRRRRRSAACGSNRVRHHQVRVLHWATQTLLVAQVQHRLLHGTVGENAVPRRNAVRAFPHPDAALTQDVCNLVLNSFMATAAPTVDLTATGTVRSGIQAMRFPGRTNSLTESGLDHPACEGRHGRRGPRAPAPQRWVGRARRPRLVRHRNTGAHGPRQREPRPGPTPLARLAIARLRSRWRRGTACCAKSDQGVVCPLRFTVSQKEVHCAPTLSMAAHKLSRKTPPSGSRFVRMR